MITDHEPDELLYPIIFDDDDDNNHEPVFTYQDPLLLCGILRAVFENDLHKIKTLVESGKSVNINDNSGNTPLHFAVFKGRVEILDYLISRDEIVLDSRNFYDQTPILLAAKEGKYDMVKTLIDAGSEVNIPIHFRSTPLHAAVKFPKIAELLISNGAEKDALDEEHKTALHRAVYFNCLETVCMLLYYNADPNLYLCHDDSPFMSSIILENVDIQSALIYYITDFDIIADNGSLLYLAITHDSPFIKNILEGGAVFHRNEFLACLRITELDRFKLVWQYVHKFSATSYDLVEFLSRLRHCDNFPEFVIAFMTNENVVKDMCMKTKLSDFIEIFQEENLADLYLKFSCIFLMNGYNLMFCDIAKTFEFFGYCELFKIMLYVDYSYQPCDMIFGVMTVAVILSVTTNLDMVKYCADSDLSLIVSVPNFKTDLENFLKLFHCQPLIDLYLRYFVKDSNCQTFPKIPTLVELARNKTREYIIKKFKVQKTSQYYRSVSYLPIPKLYKEILSYKRHLYVIPITQ